MTEYKDIEGSEVLPIKPLTSSKQPFGCGTRRNWKHIATLTIDLATIRNIQWMYDIKANLSMSGIDMSSVYLPRPCRDSSTKNAMHTKENIYQKHTYQPSKDKIK
ncbi:hypothetical protein TRV_01789 [Trichophyton verrucosum HKI 0517]|uniref:Uncharacterized protein n=1 Tax=Trichophyton verrucosum (strain HKI 0517) TaxID=663202 RepID=D4D3X6_TRIVH|nr:uncharacterized protein TRV_01789 [Trichophyton verrucosum HKI 0517]EFE43404.1 hypothetical protein TRV_01789 [Trichophyton verrucosum HKI 0517]